MKAAESTKWWLTRTIGSAITFGAFHDRMGICQELFKPNNAIFSTLLVWNGIVRRIDCIFRRFWNTNSWPMGLRDFFLLDSSASVGHYKHQLDKQEIGRSWKQVSIENGKARKGIRL